MHTDDIINQAIADTQSEKPIPAEFVFLARVMCALHGIKKPTKSRVTSGNYEWSFNQGEILKAAEAMTGNFATCSDVFSAAFSKPANASEARQVATILRNAGYKMKRSNGRNLYKL